MRLFANSLFSGGDGGSGGGSGGVTTSELLAAIGAHNVGTATHADIRAILTDLIGLPAWNATNYSLTFTARSGATLVVNLPLAALAKGLDYDQATREIVLTKQDGSTIRVSVADLIDVYTGSLGGHIQISVGPDNVIAATLLAGTITEAELSAALNAVIAAKAEQADLAALSADVDGLRGRVDMAGPQAMDVVDLSLNRRIGGTPYALTITLADALDAAARLQLIRYGKRRRRFSEALGVAPGGAQVSGWQWTPIQITSGQQWTAFANTVNGMVIAPGTRQIGLTGLDIANLYIPPIKRGGKYQEWETACVQPTRRKRPRLCRITCPARTNSLTGSSTA